MTDPVAISPRAEAEAMSGVQTTEKTEHNTENENNSNDTASSATTPTSTAPASPTHIGHAVMTTTATTTLPNANGTTTTATSRNSTTTTTTTNPLMDKVRSFLDTEGITYQAHPVREESAVVSMNLTGKSGSYRTFVEAREGQKRVLVYVECPVKVPGMRRSLAAEFLMRVNYSLALGNFELDFRDGEVRYRNAIDVDGGVLSLEMIRQLIMVPAATMDRFFGALMQVVYGTTLPAEAFEECRHNTPGNPNAQVGSSQ